MAKPSCNIWPIVNGEPSKLYKDLLNLTSNDRTLVNLIYAAYLQQGVAARIGGPVNSQGEHSARAVYDFFDVGQMLIDHKHSDYIALKRAGAIDNDGNTISYSDGKVALERADTFNSSSLGNSFVASVYQHGTEFQIFVQRRDSLSVAEAGLVKAQLKAWDTVTQAFRNKGVDINAIRQIYPDNISPVKVKDMLYWMANGLAINPRHLNVLSKKDLKLMFAISHNEPIVQRLIAHYNDVDTAVDEMYNYLRTGQASSTNTARFESARQILPRLGGIDAQALYNQVIAENDAFKNTDPSLMIDSTIKQFGKNIDTTIIELNRISGKAHSLSEVALRAVTILSRKLRDAKNEKDDQRVIELNSKLSKLMHQIDGKCYYGGALDLIQMATDDISALMNAIQTPASGTKLEQIISKSNNFRTLKDILDNYSDIIDSIAELQKVIINENIDANDLQNLQNLAIEARKKLADVKEFLDSIKGDLAVDILTEYLGDTDINGIPIATLATHATQDGDLLDKLFSSTEVSNPLVQGLSTIIRRAQQERDKEALKYDDRIQRAINKLHKSGHKHTEWMYEPNGRIISDINWEAYENARNTHIEDLKLQGLSGYALDYALLTWEEQNTEDRVVDNVSGRTEKVPNSNYRKAMPVLDAAQQEYYDTMMQIKGELGTMVPSNMRDHYTPPQIRLKFWDSVFDAYRNYKGKARIVRLLNILKEKAKDPFVWREDDTAVDSQGYYPGNEFAKAEASPDGTVKKRIPVFYGYKLRDSSFLDKNFTRAIELMNTTSVQYQALSKIENAVNFLKDYIADLGVSETNRDNKPLVDVVQKLGPTTRIDPNDPTSLTQTASTSVVTRIVKAATTVGLPGLMEGIIDSQLYQINIRKRSANTKFWTSVLKYTSVVNLAVNFTGAVTNQVVGQIQTLIEGAGGEFFSFKDWAVAQGYVLNATHALSVAKDNINGTKLSLDTLLNERFNVQQKAFSNLKSKSFYRNKLRKTLDSTDSLVLYGLGEYHIHQINLRALLRSEKVLLNGKKVSLIKVFDKTAPINGVSELIIKPGATKLDGSPITEEYLDSLRDILKLINQEGHGAMADEDKGIIHRYILGKMIMNFRQWMVKHYARRFRKATKDPLTGLEREGYQRTLGLMMLASTLDFRLIRNTLVKLSLGDKFMDKIDNIHDKYLLKNLKSNKDKMRIANLKKALAEYAIWGILLGVKWVLGGDDDDDKDDKIWGMYHTLNIIDRLLLDIQGTLPPTMVDNTLKLLNSPIPSVNTLQNIAYPITGIKDITETYKRGRFKGQNKYMHNMLYRFVPFFKQIDYFIHPEENPGIRNK